MVIAQQNQTRTGGTLKLVSQLLLIIPRKTRYYNKSPRLLFLKMIEIRITSASTRNNFPLLRRYNLSGVAGVKWLGGTLRKLLIGMMLLGFTLSASADCDLMEFDLIGSKSIEHIVPVSDASLHLNYSERSSIEVFVKDIRQIVSSNMSANKSYVAESKELLLRALNQQHPNEGVEFEVFLNSIDGYRDSPELVKSHMYVGLLRAIEWAIYQGKSVALVDGEPVLESEMTLYQSHTVPSVRRLIYESQNVTLYEICGQI